MSLVPIGGIIRPPPPRRAVASNTQGFHLPNDAPEAPTTAATTCAALSLQALLSLQDVQPQAERDRRARRQGEGLLSALTRLQRALLGENGAAQELTELCTLSAQSEVADDPALRDIVAAIRLRAAVELARADVKFCEQNVHNT
jgi:hypothetical protein